MQPVTPAPKPMFLPEDSAISKALPQSALSLPYFSQLYHFLGPLRLVLQLCPLFCDFVVFA